MLGFAATFGVLWLSRKTQPTDWAKYPAVGLFVGSILAFIMGNGWSTLTTQEKAIAFAVASAVFFLGYILSGIRKWGWLFPALGCAAFAMMNWINDMYVPYLLFVLLMASLALPFYVGFALDRKRWGLLIPALITTYVTVFILIADTVQDAWADSIILFLFALPFFVLYFWSKKNWWALIPAGFFASVGLAAALDILVPHEEYPAPPFTLSFDVYIWVVFLGLAATFGVLWLRRKTQPTG